MSTNKSIHIGNYSIIHALPLVAQTAGDEKIYLGNADAKRFIVVDAKWRKLTKLLTKPKKVIDIARELTKSNDTLFPSQSTISSVKLMMLMFARHHLLFCIDGNIFFTYYKKPRYWNIHIDTSFTKILSYPLFVGIYEFLFLSAFIIPLANYTFIPKASDYFWHTQLSFNLLSYFFLSWMILFQHELAHMLTASAYGVASRLQLSHRLHFLVVDTQFDSIFSVRKRDRIIIFASGMIVDIITIGLAYYLLILQSFLAPIFPRELFSLIRQLILIEWMTIIWQLFFFMKTDVYLIIKELVGIENLHTRSMSLIRQIFRRSSLRYESTREKRIVYVYAIFIVAGSLIAVSRYVVFNIPITLRLLGQGVDDIFVGLSNGKYSVVIDGIVVICLKALFYFLLLVTLISKNDKKGIRWL